MKNKVPNIKTKTSHWKLLLFLFLNLWVGSIMLSAQVACPTADTLLAKWDFSRKTAPCEGAVAGAYGIQHPLLAQNAYSYCPSESAGCGNARLGSRGHGNTGWFANAICLLNFYDIDKARSRPNIYFPSDYDASSTVFDPEGKANLYVEYKIPQGELGCLTEFSLQFLQKQFRGAIGFETQGLAIKKNGILVYEQTKAIQANNVNGESITFPLDVPGLCSDGTQEVTFEVIFGLVHQLNYAVVGYDNVCLRGSCGAGSATGSAEVATCGPGGGNNGELRLSGFADGERYDWVENTTYTGIATYATATPIPVSGIIVDTIGIKGVPTTYSIRLFRPDCHLDAVVVMPPTFCPYTCDWPTADADVTPATCTGLNVNDDAVFTFANIMNADKIGISEGKTYTGPDYAGATVIVGNSMTFDNIANPECLTYYTIRLFNGAEDEEQCINDVTLALSPTSCDGCTIICAQVESSVAVDSVTTNDDAAKATACKTNFFVDLELDKTMSPSTGVACNTDFEFTLTLSNTGTMTATDITVVDLLPFELTYISSSATIGAFTQGGGWYIDSLDANETAVLTITTIAKQAGTFSNCTYVDDFYPQNDPDSSPDNNFTTDEDDSDCISFTVDGPSPPLVRKSFSPEYTRPNYPTRLTLAITNYEDSMIVLTEDFVDSLPVDGVNQMVVATTPNVSSLLPGVIATGGANTITIPAGTILPTGVSEVNIDIIAPADGTYVNGFATGQLMTNIGANCEPDSADLYVDALNVLSPQITKSFSASMIEPNQVSMMTITLTNNNAASLELITDFIDYFPPGLRIATSGTNTGTCAGLLAFSAGDSTIVLPTGAVIPSGSCTIIVPVTSSIEGEHCNVVGMNALVGLVDGSMAGNEDRSEACLKVVNNPIYDLALRKSLSSSQADSVTVGSTVSYDITVINQGTRAGTGIQITDYIPAGLSLVADTIWQMSSGNAILVDPIASLEPGADTTISIQFVIDINYQGASIINSAEIIATNEGTDVDSTPDNIATNDKGGKAKSPTDDVVLGNAKLASGAPQDENGLTDEDDADPAIIYLKTETIENCAIVLNLDPQDCNTGDNTYNVNGSINFSNAPTSGDLIVVVDGDTIQTINAPFTSPQALALTGLNSDGQNHTVVTKFTAEGSCQTSMMYAAPSPCLATSTCSVSTTVNVGTCESATNTYEVTGNITFTDAPATGTLTVAIGGFQQTFAAPFTSPQAYTLTGLAADGSNHTIAVSFSDDVACSDVMDYTAPGGCDPVACGATLSVTPGTCDAGTNTFDLTGSVTFTNAPSTGILVVEVGGDTMTFAAPFTSPQAFTINDLIANGQMGQATAYFSNDVACTATANFVAPDACSPSVCAVSMELSPSPCSDDQYVLNGTVNFVNPPTTGTLTVREGGTIYLELPLPLTSPLGFTIPGLTADSASHTFQVSFSDDLACANDFTYMAPGSCTGSCALSGTITEVECRDNGTSSDNNDDYTIFSLNPTGTNLGGSYSVTSDAGTVYRLSGATATNVPYGATTVFRLANGSADATDKMINIIDDANPDCTEGPLTLTAPISCSCVAVETTIDTAICSNETYVFDGQNLNTAGIYRDSLTTAFNCDSIVILNLAVLPTAETMLDEEICNGDSYDLNGQAITTAGTFRDTVPAANGCDSIIILTLEVLDAITGFEIYNGCQDDGYAVVVGSTTYNQANPTGMETLTAANGCDSVVTVSLVYKPNTTGTETYDGCQGDGYEVVVGSTTYNESNTSGTETLTAANGCDSVVTVNLTFKPNTTGTATYDGCEGDGYEIVIGATTYNEANPTGTETLTAANGCDSIVTVTLTFKPNATGTAAYDGCEGDGYELVVGTTTYNEANPTGTETLTAANGCDSLVTVTLVYKPNATGTQAYDGCEGDGYEVVVGATTYNEANPTGTETLTAADGCDSLVTVNLVYKPNTTGTATYDGCEGDGYEVVVGATTYNEANPTGTQTLISATGCDSVVTVNLVFKPSKTGVMLHDGCEGDGYSVVVGSTTFNEANPAGMVTLTAADGCDSIVTVSLVYKPNTTGTLTYDGCQDDGYEVVVGATTYNEANPTGTETISAANGCDSVVTINLIYKPTVTGLELYDGCMGDGYEKVIGSTTYSEANPSGMETLAAANGCDSVVTVSFVYKPNRTGNENYDGCQGDGYEVVVGATTYNESNPTGTEVLTAANGCDSTVTVNLVYKPNTTGVELYDGCMGDGYERVIGGTTFNEANPSGTAILPAANGCDSVVTVSFVYKANTTGTEDYDGCEGDGYEVVVGATTYNEGNPTGTETLTAMNGCDSVVTVNLVYKPNTTGTEAYDGCMGDGYSVVVGATTYNEGNPTGTETLAAANGCDSVVTVNLVFKPNLTGTEDYDGCEGDGYEVVVGTTTYNEGNPTGTETLTATTGCDSVVTVNLVFKPNTTGIELYNGCQGDGYEVVVGATTYNEANPSGMETLTAANGCDSIVTVGLVFQSATTGTETYNGCQNDGYEVVVGATTYNEANPSGTETLTGANGCDSVVTIDLTFRNGVTGLEFYDGCKNDGYSVVVGSTTYNEANPFGMETLTAADGCDSVVTVSLVYKARPTGMVTYEGCAGDGYEVVVGSTTYNESNPNGTETFPKASGCDSLVTIDLVFNPDKTGVVLYNGCEEDGYEVVVGATTYNEANPTGMETLTATDGCDSVVTIALIFKPNATGTETYVGCAGDGYEVVVGSMTYNEASSTGMETLTAANGCDSVVTVNLVFKPNATGTEDYDGCEGDGYSVVVGASTYNEGNPTGSETLTASNGCDSVVTVNLVFNSEKTNTLAYEGCFNDGYSVTVGSTVYNEANPTGTETLISTTGCDSVVTVNLVFNSEMNTTVAYEGCENDGYEVVVGVTTYNEDNPTGTETLTAASGCDSIVTVNLVFNPEKTNTVTYDGCEDDGYNVTVGTNVYNETNPTGTEILTTADGCDSTVTVNLVYKPIATGTAIYDGCEGDGYEIVVGATTYNEANPTGTEVLTAANGCDSTVTVNLVFKPNTTGTEDYEGCAGDGYEVMVGTTIYNEANPTGTATLTAANSCDSVVTVNLVFKPNTTGTEDYEGCEGDGYEVIVGATTYNEDNPTGTATLTAANGCDSVVTVNLVFKPNTTGTEDYEGCEGDGYEVIVGATTYNEDNPTGTATLTAANGCDSVVTVSLVFNSEKTSTIAYEGCFNDGYSVTVGATTYDENNPTGTEVLTAASGCDSTVMITLVFNSEKTNTVSYEGCEEDGYEVVVGANTYNEENPTGTETLTATSGCDSIVTVNLVFNPEKTGAVTYEGCEEDGYEVVVGANTYNEENPTGTEVLTATSGCDSTITINLVYQPNATNVVTYEGCEEDGYEVVVGATTYNEDNPTGTEVLTAANGCDSTVAVNLVFNTEKTGIVAYEGCFDDGYNVTVGSTVYNEDNPTGTEVLTAANGCDSTVTVNLVFNTEKTNTITYEGCEDDGYSVAVAGTVYDENNPTGTATLTAVSGCDSIVTINLVFNANTTNNITYEGCENDGYSVLVGATTYDEGNPTGAETLTNSDGCDSTVTVNLVFNPNPTSEITYTGCAEDGYEVVVNGTAYNENNPTGTEVLTAANGCDSTVTISLAFTPLTAAACGVFDLALEKSTDATTVQLGDLVTYTLKVTNEGTIDAYNIGITDHIPDGMTLADANWTATGDMARFNTPISFLPADASYSLYITLKVDVDFTGTTLVNFAEISEADDDTDPTNTPPTDEDSMPDDDPTNPDEDDDDSAVINVVEPGKDLFDLALIEELAPGQEGMVQPGDIVDLKITIFNQGTLPAEMVEVTQYLPEGLTLNTNNPQGWTANNDSTATINVTLPTGELAPDSMIMVMIQVVVNEDLVAGKLTPNAEISDDGINDDNDSTPDDDRTNDTGGEPNTDTDNTTDQAPPTDEDDEDPVQLMLEEFDLALTETLLTEGPIVPGDSITGKIKIFNQGDIAADGIKIFAYIPEGLTLDDDRWTAMNDSTAMLTLSVATNDLPTGGLTPEEMTMITIGFTVDPTFMDTCLITYAEIGEATDENGNKVTDVDSTPDGDNTNDTGGEVHTPTDNQVYATPPTDEDDHDPMKIAVAQTFDLALEKSTDAMLVMVGDLVTYQIEVTNEGSLNAYNIGITDFLPTGMSLQDNNWTASGDTLRYNTPIAFLETGQSTIIEITMQVLPGTENMMLMNMAEITSADDDDNPDNQPPVDEDSTPDEDKTNEDEDDDDTAVVTVIPPDVFDLAIIETLAPGQEGMVRPGETVDFKITVFNQGNLVADTIKLTQYLPAGLTLNTANPQGWTRMNDSTAMLLLTAGNGLPAGGLEGDSMVMVMIQTLVTTTPTTNKLTAYAEISEDGETNDDHDSTPDDNRTNDIGGMPNTDADNAYDQIPPMDEDDHDPVQIMLLEFDLAVTEELITEGPINPGDSITAKIKVVNQGTIPADNIKIFAYIPTGMTLADDEWTAIDDSTAMRTLSMTGGLAPNEMTMVEIDFIIDPTFMEECLITYAEIGGATDENGAEVTDVDSTPDGDRTNDTGGEVDTTTDNEVNENPPVDEDDHDPVKIAVNQIFDLALIIELAPDQKMEVPDNDTVCFNIKVINQGTQDAYDIGIVNYVPLGLTYDAQFNQNTGTNWQADSTYQLDELLVGDTAIIPIKFLSNMEAMDSVVVDTAEIYFATTEDGGTINTTDIDSEADDENQDIIGGDNITDNDRGDEDDHDYVYIVPLDAVDPIGFIYADKTGKIIKGGTIAVTAPPGGVVFMIEDGSTGMYQWFTNGVQGEYVMTYTHPNGAVISPNCNAQTGVYDPTGRDGDATDMDGDATNGIIQLGTVAVNADSTYLLNPTCSDNPYYLRFFLQSGDPIIDGNNIAIQESFIGSIICEDENGNGQPDTGEPGIPNALVYLYACADTINPIDSTLSNAQGEYKFDGLNAGDYMVQFTTPDGYRLPVDAVPANTIAQRGGFSECISLTTGECDTTTTVCMKACTEIVATVSANTIREGESVTISLNGGPEFIWSANTGITNTTTSTATFYPTTTTTYTVTVEDTYGCSQTLEIPITVIPRTTNYVRIADPCNCTTEEINNTPVLSDRITIYSLVANETWTVSKNEGIYDNGSLIPLGGSFTAGGKIGLYYTYSMPIQHLDATGYAGMFTNGTDTLSADNICFADQSCSTTITTTPEGTPGPPVINPVIIIPTGTTPLIETIEDCSGTAFNSDGSIDGALYSDSKARNNVFTICASNQWQSLLVTFNQFDLAAGDTLYVFEGQDTTDALLGKFSGAGVSQTGGWVASSCNPSINATGCLTFQFKTNGDNAKGTGWRSEVTCNSKDITLTPPNNLNENLDCAEYSSMLTINPATVTADCGTVQDSQIIRIYNQLGEICKDTCVAFDKSFQQAFALGSYRVEYKLKSDTVKTTQAIISLQAPSLVCNDEITVPLGSSCAVTLTPDDLLENPCDTITDTMYYFITIKGVDKNGQETILASGGGKNGNYPSIEKEMIAECGGSVTATIERRYFEGLNLDICNNGPVNASCDVKVNLIDQAPPVFTNISTIADTFRLCIVDLTADALGIPAPTAIDNCETATVEFVDATILNDGGTCDTTRALLNWKATDGCGNVATLAQSVVILRPQLTDIVSPTNTLLSCGEDTENTLNDIAKTGIPSIKVGKVVNGVLIPTDTIALDTENYVCGYILQKRDVSIPADCGIKLYRYWEVLDWCDTQTGVKHISTQLIELRDTIAPTFVAESLPTKSVDLPHDACTLDITKLDNPAATDNCSEVSVSMDAVFRIENGARWPIEANELTALDCDSFLVQWIAEDACHEQLINDTITQLILIEDNTAPSAACVDKINLSLGQNEAKLHYSAIDGGSYDACGIAKYEVSRDEVNWDSTVTFGCDDAHAAATVYLRVTDAKGNQSTCWMTVNVEDKIAPICSDLPDMTGTCDEQHLADLGVSTDANNNGLLDDTWVDMSEEQIELFNAQYGNPNCSDNIACGALVIQQQYQLANKTCGVVNIQRRFRAIDWDGQGRTSNWSTQNINIEAKEDWTVTLPVDWKGACGDSIPSSAATIKNGNCDLVAVEIDEKVFTTTEDACLKVVRTFTIINWCKYEAGQPAVTITRTENEHGMVTEGRTITSAEFENAGKLEYVQILKLQDDTAPVITIGEVETCLNGASCGEMKQFAITATDCNDAATESLVYSWTLSSNGEQLATGDGASFEAMVTPKVNYEVIWTVADNCGNTAKETANYEFEDCKKPAPYCINGIAVELMQGAGMIQIWAKDVERGSSDNCTTQDRLAFRIWHTNLGTAPTDLAGVQALPEVITFDCTTLGQQNVNLYTIDEAGNWDFCTTYVIVQDNMNACKNTGTTGMAVVSGSIRDWKGKTVEEVSVNAMEDMEMMTQADGFYNFELAMNHPYTIQPEKNEQPLNGVTTFDLVLISKHILGINEFENPYQMIAADVNQSGSITAFDMVQIRQLILNIKTEFTNNDSWRFVDAAYEFATDSPMTQDFPEVIQIADLQHDMEMDFVAIKVGDVNGSAQPNSLVQAENRTTTNTFEITTEDKVLKAGETYSLAFTTEQLATIQGYQFTLGYEDLKLKKLHSGIAGVENFGLHKMDEGMITTSWNRVIGNEQDKVSIEQTATVLFSIEFTASKDGKLSEQLSINNRPTKIEAYSQDNELMDVQLTFTTPLSDNKFELFQNHPNPFHDKTTIGFYLPGDSDIELLLRDETGRILKVINKTKKAGYNVIQLEEADLTNGFIYYQLSTKFGTKAKKMLRLR